MGVPLKSRLMGAVRPNDGEVVTFDAGFYVPGPGHACYLCTTDGNIELVMRRGPTLVLAAVAGDYIHWQGVSIEEAGTTGAWFSCFLV